MDGLTAVQARISQIQTRFTPQIAPDLDRLGVGRGRRRPERHHRGLQQLRDVRGGTASETAVVAEATKHLGIPYLWGGTDPAKGLDCSGLVAARLRQPGHRPAPHLLPAGHQRHRRRLARRRPPR